MPLGQFGIWRRYQEGLGPVPEIERLGFGTLWLGGSPSLAEARTCLDATSTLTVATGILNVWRHEPADVAAGHAELRGTFGERFLLGVGIGHPEATSEYKKPLTKMREFLDGLDASRPAGTARPAPGRRARSEDARSRGRAVLGGASLLHDHRAHPLRARADRA